MGGRKAAAPDSPMAAAFLLNDRLSGTPGDFSTRECGLGQIELKRPWESCLTLQHYQFSWNPNRRVKPRRGGMLIARRTARPAKGPSTGLR